MSGFLWEAGLGVGGLRDRSFSFIVGFLEHCLLFYFNSVHILSLFYHFLQNLQQFLKHNGK